MPLLLGFTASESGCLLRKRRSEFTCCSGTFSASPSSQCHQLKQARAPSTIIQLARLACVISYWPGIDGEQQLSERGGQITFTVGILCAALLLLCLFKPGNHCCPSLSSREPDRSLYRMLLLHAFMDHVGDSSTIKAQWWDGHQGQPKLKQKGKAAFSPVIQFLKKGHELIEHVFIRKINKNSVEVANVFTVVLWSCLVSDHDGILLQTALHICCSSRQLAENSQSLSQPYV